MNPDTRTITEPAREIPVRDYDVVVAGGGTGGVVAALAAAASGAKTALIEAKGYVGGIVVEGGTALHSFFNLWKAFPGVERRQVVRGIPAQIVDRLTERGGATGHAEMSEGYGYDSVCTAVDTEQYKLLCHEMLAEAGVHTALSTILVSALGQETGAGRTITAAVTESRSGREAWVAPTYIDATGYGDLAAHAGAEYSEPNDYPVANSIGVGGVSIEGLLEFLESHHALAQRADGLRSGKPNRIVRLDGRRDLLPEAFNARARDIGMAVVTTSVHDNYFMFIKLNYTMPTSPTSRDAVAEAELELRRRQAEAIELIREWIPGCRNAFIARTSPTLCIRRGRLIACDYDLSPSDVVEGRHFPDDVGVYGFHDFAPRIQIREGRTYGYPYRALLPRGITNLYATGMMITSDHEAHMSTRNTVACMVQGQAAGHAAALCSAQGVETRALQYESLRSELVKHDVCLEP